LNAAAFNGSQFLIGGAGFNTSMQLVSPAGQFTSLALKNPAFYFARERRSSGWKLNFHRWRGTGGRDRASRRHSVRLLLMAVFTDLTHSLLSGWGASWHSAYNGSVLFSSRIRQCQRRASIAGSFQSDQQSHYRRDGFFPHVHFQLHGSAEAMGISS